MSSRPEIKADPDDEAKDTEHHRSHHKNKLSHRKKGRANDSNSKNSEDKQSEEEVVVDKGRVPANDQESDDELDDDEEDYDDEDQDSHESFIAADEEVEQELLEEKERDKAEGRKKKKKRKQKSFSSLEDDDYQLIEDNTGKRVTGKPPRKRLIRGTEKEQNEGQTEEGKTSQKANVKQEQADQAMSDSNQSEEEAFQARGQTREKERKRAPVVDQRSYEQQDPDRMNIARHIFEDHRNLAEEIAARKQHMEENQQQNDITALFDGEEIDDQFATKVDKLIAEKDIPERLQLKLGEYQDPTEEDLQIEADWISERMFQDYKKKEMMYNSAHVKQKIQKVLKMFRVEHLDIPMITKYRRFEYMKELDEQDVWMIFNLDLEYAKYKEQKAQISAFIKKVMQFDPELRVYQEELHFVKNQNQLNDFSTLITFLKSYYIEELAMLPEEQKKRVPGRTDLVQNARKYRLDEFARQCMLKPQQFVENLQNNSYIHVPPEITDKIPINLAQEYFSDYYNEEIRVFSGVCTFVSHELAAQPYIRGQLKKEFWKHGFIVTNPTEQGQKDIDIFHPSYKIKRIEKQPLEDFKYDEKFLDIIQNEKAKLITLQIEMEKGAQENFYIYLESLYITQNEGSQWNIMRKEVLRKLYLNVLYPEIVKEITNELKEYAENYVISKCKDRYRNLLMTGPFQTSESRRSQQQDDRSAGRGKASDDEVIKDRPRLNVMGVVLQQIDNNNSAVTIAVVDKYGELVAHKDLLHLMPPRKPKNIPRDDQDQGRTMQQQHNKSEEDKEHEKDKDKIMELIKKHSVDLIVVGANKLEARKIKETLKDIAEKMKNYGGSNWKNEDDPRGSKGSRQGDAQLDERKEAFVIWGSLEIPKLFSSSHQSTKLLKNCHPILKQAVSLARFEQDPMSEILNLWSSAPSENQILSCNLHPLQKQLNQAKLADSLEEISIQCVNDVGVDLNVLVDHDYLHATLQFISGLGPRKARKLIQKIKSTGKKITTRGEIYKDSYLGKFVYISAVAFLKIRCPVDENGDQYYDLLDQTRIHQESYVLALKVACDVLYDQQEMGDKYQQYQAVKEVIMNPHKLKNLDVKKYNSELEMTGQANMTIILDQIIEELQNPFKDPREYRNPNKLQIDNQQLFYMLIDESERTFKRGIIVTATAVKVLDKKVYCKLDNGLDAIIFKEELIGKNIDERLDKAIQPGHVISGRISEIKLQQEHNFSVTLNCKRKALESHEDYIPSDIKYVHPDDMKNFNFQTEKKDVKQSRYQSRRINHPKFFNISSTKALQELQDKEIGEFVFRPSSKGGDNITLTWKFYTNNIVHMDIEEKDKPTGASIGNRLKISDESFESLQEIVDRYIIPCNRALREVIHHPKFMQCHSQEEIEASLKQEKNEDQQRIPYKFTILEKYPQHIVLGYIPKTSLVKEYIKIKPKGYYFHGIYHNPFQHLINWFKENFKSKEYLKVVRRQKSPRVKTANDMMAANRNNRGTPQADWGEVSKDWKKSAANSVHSMNDDYAGDSQTPLIMKTEHTQSKQSEYGAQEGQTSGTGMGAFSDYNQNNQMSSFRRDQPENSRGPPRGQCYNCNETGHISKDCPSKDNRQRGARPSRDRNDENYSRPRGGENGDYQQHREEGVNSSNQAAPYKSPAGNWGVDSSMKQESSAPKSPGGWGAKAEGTTPKVDSGWQAENPAAGGWGSKTPQRNDSQPSWGGAAAVSTGEAWGNSSAMNNDNDNDRRNSPTRSQKSYDDNRGERGRGRGGRGRGGPGGGGSGRACFKCNEEGHMARECPNAESMPRDSGRGGRGGGGPRTCYKCNEEGHMARECPNPSAEGNDRGRGRGGGRGGFGGGNRACFKCNQEGHMARECPNEGDDRGQRPYKRQRREDGGSVRRENDDNNSNTDWNNQGAAQSSSAWDDNQGRNGWGSTAAVAQSSNENGQDNSAWGQQTSNVVANEEGGWNQASNAAQTSNVAQPKPSDEGNSGWNQNNEGGW